MHRVCVIIPTYNRARLVTEALSSVLAQTYEDVEALVVDDGSTDDTRRRLETRYGANARVRVIAQRNAGPAAARNLGIRSSRSELVAFLDSDDLWEREKLALQVERLDRSPDAGMCFCDRRDAGDGPRTPTRFQNRGFAGDTTLAGIVRLRFPFSTPSVLVRRSVLDDVGGFDESLVCAEDWDLWIRVLARYPAVYVDRPLIRVRKRGDSINRSRSLDKWRSWMLLWRKHENLLLEAGCPARVVRDRRAHAHKKLAQALRREGHGREAATHYLQWWRLQPWQIRGLFWSGVLRRGPGGGSAGSG